MWSRRLLLLALVPALLALAGCGGPDIAFDATGGDYTSDTLQTYLADANLGGLDDMDVAEAPEARRTMLAGLRSRGDAASEVADLLTRGFPDGIAAVPVRAEAATVDGGEVWLVVEVWGDETGPLTHRRLWVFNRSDGSVITALSLR